MAQHIRLRSMLLVAIPLGILAVIAWTVSDSFRGAQGAEDPLDGLWAGADAIFEPGAYEYEKAEEFEGERHASMIEVHWHTPSEWVKVTRPEDGDQPDTWLFRDGEQVYAATPGFAEYGSVWDSEPQHPELPERFLFDPYFLVEIAAEGGSDDGMNVSELDWDADGQATDGDALMLPPERLVVDGEEGDRTTFSMTAHAPDEAMSPAAVLERMREDGIEFLEDPGE